MSARDVLAASLWLIDREIAGAPLPHPSWETFRENDPETAMIYETQAGCHLAALAAAGWVVVPREAVERVVLRRGPRGGHLPLPKDIKALAAAVPPRFAAALPAAPQEDRDDA